MSEVTLKLTAMANGGLALGRDARGRPIFVPSAIVGETVRVRLRDSTGHFARAELVEVISSSPDRVAPLCRHFGVCGNCHFQHMTYEAQLRAKEAVVRDQLERVAGLRNPPLRPIRPFPRAYGYRSETTLFPAEEGRLGYWSPSERRIFPVVECPVLEPELQGLLGDIDIDLPDLRKLTLRQGAEGELLAALEVEGVEPPELATDFPVSVAIVLPDRTAASLIGDPYLVYAIKGRLFRVSPGVPFPASVDAADMVIDAVLELAALQAHERVLESPGHSGWLTAALSAVAGEVTVIEPNADAVADAAANLDAFDNVAIYQGTEPDVLPGLEAVPDLAVFRPEDGLSAATVDWLRRARPSRVIVTGEAGVLAKDAKRLAGAGYRPVAFQPLDLMPQAYRIDVLGVWIAE